MWFGASRSVFRLGRHVQTVVGISMSNRIADVLGVARFPSPWTQGLPLCMLYLTPNIYLDRCPSIHIRFIPGHNLMSVGISLACHTLFCCSEPLPPPNAKRSIKYSPLCNFPHLKQL